MQRPWPSHDGTSRSILIAGVIAGAVVLLTLLVWLWPRNRSAPPVDDETELALRGFTPEELARMREGVDKTTRERVASYYALPEELRPAYLDKVIDDQLRQLRRRGLDPADLDVEAAFAGPSTQRSTRPGDELQMSMVDARERPTTQKLSPEDQQRLEEFSRALAERYRERGMDGAIIMMHTSGDPGTRPWEPGT